MRYTDGRCCPGASGSPYDKRSKYGMDLDALASSSSQRGGIPPFGTPSGYDRVVGSWGGSHSVDSTCDGPTSRTKPFNGSSDWPLGFGASGVRGSRYLWGRLAYQYHYFPNV
ncbi:hypothetical protein BV22DRAFT_917435 [Leucogyrophana mollusca]|uniref:Uncharacterized protein n=1 Tax=Leucogyrophana mollusca TaxID=85980 RepID=A0ACB8AXJ7_9AGAM|nr:hypothetical protein BV22DRAFT_917435 [Leucogyrophana mollusca]